MPRIKKVKIKDQVVQVPPLTVYDNQTSNEQAAQKFVETLEKSPEISNDSVSDFLKVIGIVRAERGSFTFSDVIASAKFLDFSTPTLKFLFDKYTESLLSLNKLETVTSVYDEPVFVFVN